MPVFLGGIMNFLNTKLPQNIEVEFSRGNYKAVEEMLKFYLQREKIPNSLKNRLEYLKINIKKIRNRYKYNKNQIMNLLKERFTDFSEEELEKYKINGSIDYLYVDGEEKYLDNAVDSIIRTLPELKKRDLKPETDNKNEFLNYYIDKLIQKKKIKIKIRIKSEISDIEITNDSFSKIRVWLPIPSVKFQVKELNLLNYSENMKYISNTGNNLGLIYFEENEKEKKFFVEYEYVIEQKLNEIDFQKASYIFDNNFTQEIGPHILFSELIRDVSKNILNENDSKIVKAKKIYDYITKNIKYSYMRPYSTYDHIPEYVILNERGDCGMQVLLFITLCRYNGIPAKWQSGLYITRDKGFNHDWAQFYIEPYGWLFADLSFGGSRKSIKKLHDFYFGNIDPLRMPANNRFQYPLFPKKLFFRNDPYDNQSGEVETDKESVFSENFKTSHKVINIAEIL